MDAFRNISGPGPHIAVFRIKGWSFCVPITWFLVDDTIVELIFQMLSGDSSSARNHALSSDRFSPVK